MARKTVQLNIILYLISTIFLYVLGKYRNRSITTVSLKSELSIDTFSDVQSAGSRVDRSAQESVRLRGLQVL